MPRTSRETVDLVTQPNDENPLQTNGHAARPGPSPSAPLRRHGWAVGLLLPVAAAVVCGVSAFVISDNFVTPWYTSATTLYFPAVGNQGASSFLNSLMGGSSVDSSGSVPILNGMYTAPLVGSGPGTAIMALSSARTQSQVATRLHLQQQWHLKPDKVAERLTKNVTYGLDKNNLLSVQANDTDPRMAQRLVNAYVLAMQDVSKQLSISQSHRIRVALQENLRVKEAALQKEQDALVTLQTRATAKIPLGTGATTAYSDLDSQRRTALIELKATQAEIDQKNRTAQAANGVSLPAQIPFAQQARQRLRDLQTKLATAKATLGPDNPQLQELQIETQQAQDQYTAELGRELTVVKKGIAPDMATLYAQRASLQARLDGIQTALAPMRSAVLSLPETQMEQQRLTANLTRDEKLVDDLAMSVQQAQIAEQRDVPTFEVVDPAGVPAKPSLPRVGYTTALATVAGFLLALAWQAASVLLRQPVTQTTIRRWSDAYGLTEGDDLTPLPGHDVAASLPTQTAPQLSHAPTETSAAASDQTALSQSQERASSDERCI